MEKLNVAELLRDCPSGMKLDCALVENLYFDCINDSELDDPYPIQCYTQNGSYRTSIRFNEYGHYTLIDNSKCVIFPEGKTTWEGFQRPFKDGDIVFYDNCVGIFKEWGDETLLRNYVKADIDGRHPMLCDKTSSCGKDVKKEARFATEEEKKKLFDAIKSSGHKWDEETKTLEKLPKFKDGDIVVNNSNERSNPFIYKGKNKDYYECYVGLTVGSNPILVRGSSDWIDIPCELRFATEEEKRYLFDAIKESGYKWNAETKTLEELAPIFKIGNKIKHKTLIKQENIVTEIKDTYYILDDKSALSFIFQDEYELVSDKFDITTLIPFESKVLVWDDTLRKWIPAFWGNKCDSGGYITTYGWCKYCIPFDGNEHLTGTSKDCDKFFKIWK